MTPTLYGHLLILNMLSFLIMWFGLLSLWVLSGSCAPIFPGEYFVDHKKPEDSHPWLVLSLSGLTQTKQGYLVVSYLCCHLCCLPCHSANVPGDNLGGPLGCQKGGWPFRPSLQCVILPLHEGPYTPKSNSLGFVTDVSVTDLAFPVKSCLPYPNPLPSWKGGPS